MRALLLVLLLLSTPTLAFDIINLFDAHYPYRIANGFNGSHWAPERSVYLRLTTNF